jgi:hypothetical protein
MFSPTQPSQFNQPAAANIVIRKSRHMRPDIFTKVHIHCSLLGTANTKKGEITEVLVEPAVFIMLDMAKGLFKN